MTFAVTAREERSEQDGNATSMRYGHKRDINRLMCVLPFMGVDEDMVKERSESMDKAKEISALWSQIKPQIGKLVSICHEVEDHYEVTADAYQRGYEAGLNDAWEAARTLWNTPNRKEIFGHTTFNTVLTTLTAQEAIEKIRQYEQEQEEQITKGDIVLIKSTPEVEILVTYADEEYVSGIALTEVDGNCEIGDQYTNIRISNVEKTGKHYDIVSVLQKMRGSE